VVLDTTVVNVSLPYIAGSLSSTVEDATWALTSYLAANAVILPMTGWLANFFGRKRLLLVAVLGFTTASFACGLAVSLPMLVVFRIIQGLTGGVMQPLSQAVMLEAFPPRDRGKAMGFWGLGIVVAPILGPVLGGWLTANYSWRWVFFINIPVGIVAILMQETYIFDPAYIKRASTRIDWWGISLLTIGVAALQISLDKGQEEDWLESRWIAALIAVAIVTLVVLVVRELAVEHPIVDLRVLKDRTYATGLVLMTLLGFVLYGSLVLLPILLQTMLGYPPLAAGIALAPRGMGSFLAMPLVGLVTAKVDPRKLLASGFALTAVTLFWFGQLDLNAGYWDLFWPQFLQGVSLGLLFVPLTTITMDNIPRHAMGNATSLFNLMRNLGGSVGIALVTTLLARNRQIHTTELGAHVNLWNPVARHTFDGLRRALVGASHDMTTATSQARAAIWGMVLRQASILSFLDAFRALGVLVVVVTPLVLLMHRPKHEADTPVVAVD
jgi:MFS transporter, DHA2 family, multidrug resistance protein